MEPPAPSDPVRLRVGLRAAALVLVAAAAACAVVAGATGRMDGSWAAWAAGAYVSWAVALSILVRRRLARAARGAQRLNRPPREGRLRTRQRALPPLLLALLVGGATAAGATHVAAGILAAAASAALAAATYVARAEAHLGGALYVDRGAAVRGPERTRPRSLWLDASGGADPERP